MIPKDDHPAESKTPSMSFPLSSPNTLVSVVVVNVVVANKGALSSGDDDDDDDVGIVPVRIVVGRSVVLLVQTRASSSVQKRNEK